MRSALPLVVLCLAACAGEVVPATTSSEIIGGVNDTGHDAVVLLSNELVAGCSGTLISSKIVLTAAHCVVDGGRIRVLDSVTFGSSSSSNRRARGANVVWHPDYKDGYPWNNDIALIVLESRSTVEPLGLHTTLPSAGQEVTFVGFGLQSSPDGTFGQKQKVTVPIDEVEDEWIFYGPGTCQGDSGGPALITVDGKELVAAITSWGEIGCNGTNAAQRVDRHIAWLQEQLDRWDPPSCERDNRCITGCPGADADCPCSPTDGACSALCTDPESDPDCPRGCGPGDSCVRGATCPAPDPDCGDPCGGEGHCLESCATRDPDCPAPKQAGEACTRNFDCDTTAICHTNVCANTCPNPSKPCGNGGTCTQLTPQVALCTGEDEGGGGGGGCSVAGGGATGAPWALLAVVAWAWAALRPARTLRPRSRRASSRR